MGRDARGRGDIQGMNGKVPVILVERRDKGERSLLHELKELALAAGYEVVGVVTQRRPPDPRFNLGAGKVRELAELVRRTGARKVIFFNELKPHQAYNLMKELGVEVTDRFYLILEIFAQRAGSTEAKLQIELARLKRDLSFIREWLRLAKLGELHGFMGGGEYAIDAYYKHVRRRIARIERTLAELRARKEVRWRVRAEEKGLYYVALTGYTGAGKTTLFNRLTGYNGYVDGRPFATLSTKMRRALIRGRPIILSDTVGFIDCLPPQLLDAFYTTLGEVALADLVLLVFDVSEPVGEVSRKLSASLSTLQSLGVSTSRLIAVANKVDLLSGEELEERLAVARRLGLDPIPISALKGSGIDRLEERIISSLPRYAVRRIRVGGRGVLRRLYENAYVRRVEVEDGQLVAVVEGKEEWLEAMARRCAAR